MSPRTRKPFTAADAAPTLIRELGPGEPLESFIDLQWIMNADDPNWVPPLRRNIAIALDRRKHPFHAHAEVAYFVAEQNGKVVGRIAAIVNHLHNEVHEDRVGFFGLFECQDDPEIACALLDRAAEWLDDRGMQIIRGPVNFSTNEEIASPGALIDGFDSPPSVMMTHNPPYYGELFDRAGFGKAKDTLAFLLDRPDEPPKRGIRTIDRILAREGVTVRSLDLSRFEAEVDAIKKVYNSAWSRNWGFVPMTDAEFEHLARDFRSIVDPDLCLVAEADGEPVGFSLALPNLNEALRHIPSGRLFPFGWARLLWHMRSIRSMRVMTLGFKPHLHHAGLGPAMYMRKFHSGVDKGYVRGEASWILEDNVEMIRALERMGGKPYKRYRIYEKTIS